ncbi:MAG: glycosyltransferase family 2 protein [Planctomycetota bacterium]|nr:glycosyltransferase family 2 protein [Planctomycetota bacterium]
MRLTVVIVNYRSAQLALDCLDSLAQERHAMPGLDVTVVENDSPDDSFDVLAEAVRERGWSQWVAVEKSPRNGGFSYGVNIAVRRGLATDEQPDGFLLLNPDPYVREGAVRALVDELRGDDSVGIVGSRLEDPDGTVQHSRFRFPSICNEFDDGLRLGVVHRLLGDRVICPPHSDEAHDIDWVAGASMLIRREVFERVGLFDDGFFLYFEELDYARRARALGVRVRYAPLSRVVHLVGQSTGVTSRDGRPRRTPRYWFDSRKRYYKKHHSTLYKLFADAAFVFGRSAHHLLRVLRRRPDRGPPRYLWDFVRHNWLPRRAPSSP